MNKEEIEEFIRNNLQKANHIISSLYKPSELLKVGNRNYVSSYKYPESRFDIKELLPKFPPSFVMMANIAGIRDTREPFGGPRDRGAFLMPPNQLVFKLDNVPYRKSGIPETAGQVAGGLTDAAVIQAAIDALPVHGGQMFVKAEEYDIDSTITLSSAKRHIIIKGEVPGFTRGTIFAATAAVDILSIEKEGIVFVGVEDININGKDFPITGIKFHGKSQDIWLDRVIIIRCDIGATLGHNTWVTNSWIEMNNIAGLKAPLPVSHTNMYIHNNLFYDNPIDILAETYIEYGKISNNHSRFSGYFLELDHAADSGPIVSIGNVIGRFSNAAYHFVQRGAKKLTIIGEIFDGAGVTPNYMVVEATFTVKENILVCNSTIVGTSGVAFVGNLTGITIRDNLGYVTENSGAAIILNGANSVVVAHGLAGTPTSIIVTGTHAEVETAYVDTVGAANFTIHKGGAGNVTADRDVYWKAQYMP